MSSRPSSSLAVEPPSPGSAAQSETLLTPPFVLMLCVQFCFGLSYSSFFLLPKFLARELHAHADAIGAVASTALLAGVLAVPAIGAALDRGSRRPFMAFGALINGLSACAFTFVHAVSPLLFVLRAVNGVSYALVFNATVTLAADLAPPKKLGQAIGLCGAAGMFANAIAPAFGERIADRYGWSPVFLFAGGAALCASLISLAIRESRPAPAAPLVQEAATATSALGLVRDPKRLGAFVCGAANGAVFGVMFTFTPPFALSLGAHQVSVFFVGYTLSALCVRVFLGSLADNLGRERIAFVGLVLYGLVACMTSLLRPELLFVIGGCMGFAHGLLYPAVNALAVEGVPRARRGAAMSYFSGGFNGGFAIWVLGLGVLAKSRGYAIVFLVTGAMAWLSLLALPRRSRKLAA